MAQAAYYATQNANPYPGKPGAAPLSRRAGPSDQRIVELVITRAQESLRYNQNLFTQLQSYYNTYRGIWTGYRARYRNNITIPFTFAMIQSLVARKVQALFGSWPIVSFEGYAPDDEPRAKKNEVLISAQMKDVDSVRKATDFFLGEAICGTGIARYGWKTLQRRVRTRHRVSVAPGMEIGVIHDDPKATVFDGPDWEVIDRLDCWQQPAKLRIEDGWLIHRYWRDLDDLLEDAASDNPYFERASIEALANFPLQSSSVQEYNARRLTFRNELDYQARLRERFSRPVEILEMHGPVPEEFAVNGIRHRVIAIGNGRVVMKNIDAPLGDVKPFIKYCSMPDPYSFDGVGKAEVAFGPQRTADRLNNQRLDALDLLIDPQWVMNSNVQLNTQHLFSRAGRVLMVDGPANEDTIRALSPDMRGANLGAAEVSQLFQWMQLGTGETEVLLGGGGGSNRETARGFLGKQENALNRLGMETTLGGEGFVEPLANGFRRMDQLWLPLPQEVKILGSLASVDPVSGMPYAPENRTIDYDDLSPDYRARAVGPTQMLSRANRQQNLTALLQMMSANPALMQLVNWANFARQAFELFDFRNVGELLNSGPTAPMVNQLAQQSGQSPQQVAQTAATPLEQLSPESLMAFGNNQPPAPLNGTGMH